MEPRALVRPLIALALMAITALSIACDPVTEIVLENRLTDPVTVQIHKESGIKYGIPLSIAAKSSQKTGIMAVSAPVILQVNTAEKTVLERRFTKEDLEKSARITIIIE